MTANQVNWVNAMETRRANKEAEAIKRETNDINAQHYARQDQETQRSNMANEALKQQSNDITKGYYLATISETQRSNMARENETNRSNLAQEALKTRQLNIDSYGKRTDRMNAKTNAKNAKINAKNAATNAKNAATNAYNAKTNRAALAETSRANKENEAIRKQSNLIQQSYNEGMLKYTGERVRNETGLASLQAQLLPKQKKEAEARTSYYQAQTVTEQEKPGLVVEQRKETKSRKIKNYLDAASNILDSTLPYLLPALSGGN